MDRVSASRAVAVRHACPPPPTAGQARKSRDNDCPVLNNRELAELAMRRPASLAKLREIEGIGEAS
ncbi:MAG: HRDC domain-containing protein [Elusimicrobia bacterium]|nr:HRDC domain-containing protein [Elusimicrobiota bacterium]